MGSYDVGILLAVFAIGCGDAELDENGYLPPFPDGMVTNGVCAPVGEKFVETYDCALVEGPSPKMVAGASAKFTNADPLRVDDPDRAWVVAQIESCSCICCHTTSGKGNYRWAVDFTPHWTDSADEGVLRKLAGQGVNHGIDEYVNPDINHGFSREFTGPPTTDHERLQAYLEDELGRRAE